MTKYGLASSSRQPCVNKFLARWSRDNLDSVYLKIQYLICVNISNNILVDLLSVINSHRHAQSSTAALLVINSTVTQLYSKL